MENLPGYDPDMAKSRTEARKIMQSLGYGPEKWLSGKISARNLAIYRDPPAILADQLKQIWIDSEIDLVETANWLRKEDVVRPILYHMRQATCWRPEVKGIILQVNSIYNGWRTEDVWLDR